MSSDEKTPKPKHLRRRIKEQNARIEELEKQLDYFKKRFVAAKQAAAWLESKLKWKLQDSYGT